MRKLVVVSAVVIVFLALGAGIAVADDAKIQCTDVPCYASGKNDLVRTNRYTNVKDVVEGGIGNGRIFVNDGDRLDTANAG